MTTNPDIEKKLGNSDAPYTFQFSYIGRDDKEHFGVMDINYDFGTAVAMEIALAHAKEFGKFKIQWFVNNRQIKSYGDKREREGREKAVDYIQSQVTFGAPTTYVERVLEAARTSPKV